MAEGKVYKETIDELENLYEQRKVEYQKTKDVKNRLEITKEINMTEFKKMYSQLDESLLKMYGLNLDKSIEELTITEIEYISSKLDSTFNDITSKLKNYLRTGKVEEIEDLLVKEIPVVENQTQQQEVNSNSLTEQPKVTINDESLDVFK